jgi:hypothetical protein
VSEHPPDHRVDPEAGEVEDWDEPQLDPYTPEPGPSPGDQRAFALLRWAWVPVLVGVAVVLYAAVR